jgi:hypothetical protein
MKKVVIAIGIIVVLAGAALVYVALNIDSLAKRVIETAGTNTMGTAVRVGSVDIDLRNGHKKVKNPNEKNGVTRRVGPTGNGLLVSIARRVQARIPGQYGRPSLRFS